MCRPISARSTDRAASNWVDIAFRGVETVRTLGCSVPVVSWQALVLLNSMPEGQSICRMPAVLWQCAIPTCRLKKTCSRRRKKWDLPRTCGPYSIRPYERLVEILLRELVFVEVAGQGTPAPPEMAQWGRTALLALPVSSAHRQEFHSQHTNFTVP